MKRSVVKTCPLASCDVLPRESSVLSLTSSHDPPPQFNICSANKHGIAAENIFSSDLLRTMAAPEIRMFIYGHQYLIEFTLILC